MKKNGFLILMLLALTAFAQDAPYRSTTNPHYWKNRKPFEGYWQQDVEYKIRATLDDKTHIITAEQELTYFNNSPDTLRFVYFHLYQNAFVKGAYLEKLNLANGFKQRFGKYEQEGLGTTIQGITVHSNGVAKETSFMLDYSIMKVELFEPLLPNSSVVFNIHFKTYFDDGGNQRRRMKTFTDAWGNKQFDGVHWYPRICVYDRKFGWETDQHIGKEFYGDYGSYDVELTLPNNYILEATGVLQNREEVLPDDLRARIDITNFKDKPYNSPPSEMIKADGSTKTWKFKSINTHDFAWVADRTFRIGETIVTLNNGEEVSCISLVQEPHASGWQDASTFCARIIEVYSRDIGNYAYPKIIVADARDGMEYPMLTLDNGRSPGYYGLIAHEVGHNWFFGMVGNNETYRASLDEGFAQFLTNWGMTSIFGEYKPTKANPNPVSRMDQTVYWGYLRDAIKQEDAFLNTHSDDFNGALHHGGGYSHVYYKTAAMLYNLQYVLGDQLFINAMQHYFNQWKMCHPYVEDFRNSIINYTHVDLNWFFDQWLETTKSIDYSVRKHRKVKPPGNSDKDVYHITFSRDGTMQMPIDFTVYSKDSLSYNFHIPNTYFIKQTDATVLPVWKGWGILNREYEAQISLPKGTSITNIQIDPTYRLADIYQPDNSTKSSVYFTFDRLKTSQPNRKHYLLEWRPDLWYNKVDGFKAGVHFEGGYLNHNDVFSATIWYNTLVAQEYNGNARNEVDFNLRYRNAIGKHKYQHFQFRKLDGLNLMRIGFDFERKHSRVEIYLKGLHRQSVHQLDYLLYANEWNPDKSNYSLNIDRTATYANRKNSGEYKYSVRASFFGDYDYSRIYMQWIHHQAISKLELHSRIYVHAMRGSKIAPESQLYLSGANPEDMMENKFIRSQAFVPQQWLGYGANYNHFHAGGGLNVRGYAGYLVPRNVESTQVMLYKGINGVSGNFELDLDELIPFKPRKIGELFHLDAYLFGDAGLIQNEFRAGEFGLTEDKSVASNVMVSSGAGCALTLKRWGNFSKLKPLTLRFDMPLFLSNTPFVDGEYARFRWVMGVSRSF